MCQSRWWRWKLLLRKCQKRLAAVQETDYSSWCHDRVSAMYWGFSCGDPARGKTLESHKSHTECKGQQGTMGR